MRRDYPGKGPLEEDARATIRWAGVEGRQYIRLTARGIMRPVVLDATARGRRQMSVKATPGRPPAVLLGGAMNALSVARSLWRAGVTVDVLGGSSDDSPAQWSRAVRRYVRTPAGENPTDHWIKWLQTEADPSIVLPCSDEGLEMVARHREELTAEGHQPIEANDAAILVMLDKSRTYELARSAGVPAPATMTLRTRADLERLDSFSFPCAIKPVESHVFSRRFRASGKATRVRDPNEARRILGPLLDEQIPMLLTEVVEGGDECCSYYTYIDTSGEPLFHFTKRKPRQYPTNFGLGTYHLSEWQPDVAELGLRFCRAAELRGVANVEFKRDRRDGLLKLIECNARFTNAQEVVKRSGLDMGLVAYARLADLPLPPLDSFRDNVGLLFLVEDVKALRQYQRDGELSFMAWVRSLLCRQAPAYFDWRDPKPSARNFSNVAWRAGRRLGRTASGRARASNADRDPYDPC